MHVFHCGRMHFIWAFFLFIENYLGTWESSRKGEREKDRERAEAEGAAEKECIEGRTAGWRARVSLESFSLLTEMN